jgi:hypothetical protein
MCSAAPIDRRTPRPRCGGRTVWIRASSHPSRAAIALRAGSSAGNPAHDEKRLPQHARVGACEERLGDRDPGGIHRLEHGEFLDPAEARRDPGRRVGAQDEALMPGQRTPGKFGIEAKIQLDRAAVEEFQPGYIDPARAARAGEESGERGEVGRQVRSRQRRGRHRPR